MEKRWFLTLAGLGLLGLWLWVSQKPPLKPFQQEILSERGSFSIGSSNGSLPLSSKSMTAEAKTVPPADLETATGKEIPGEKIIVFTHEESLRNFLASAPGGGVLGVIDRFRAVRVRDGDWLRSKIQNLQADQSPNYYVETPRIPLDFQEQGDALYEGVGVKALEMMGAGGATREWGKAVAIAVVDTGISSVLAESMDEGHGMAMASLISGAHRPAQGAAPGATLLDFPVLGKDGVGDAFSLAQAILKAVDQGARVINMSLGSPGDSPVVREAVAYAVARNVALVAAVGNESVNRVNYPAAYEGVLAVASVDAARQHLYFSNRGPQVDVAAPGYEVVAAWPGRKYVELSGTSGSTALVSGAIAALMSQEPGLTGVQAARLIVAYADDTGNPGQDDETGSGLVNLRRVLERNTRGILDAAVAGVAIREEGSLGRITVAVQNRGTEMLLATMLEISAGNERRKFFIRSLAPGQTVAESMTFDLARARQEGGVGAGVAVSARGDQRNENDLWSGYFGISKQKQGVRN